MFAETILMHGGELNVWLPFGRESFCAELVRPYGEQWVWRFHDCLERAHTVSCATESDHPGESSLFNFCADVAMGMAIMRANHLFERQKLRRIQDVPHPPRRTGREWHRAEYPACRAGGRNCGQELIPFANF